MHNVHPRARALARAYACARARARADAGARGGTRGGARARARARARAPTPLLSPSSRHCRPLSRVPCAPSETRVRVSVRARLGRTCRTTSLISSKTRTPQNLMYY